MLKCYLDSNVLIGYSFEKSTLREQSLRVMKYMRPDKYAVYISSLTIDEFLHSLSFLLRRNGNSKYEISKLLHQSLADILSFPNISVVNPPNEKNKQIDVLGYMKKFDLKPRDAYHFLIMQEQNIKYFATFDTDFKKVFKSGKIKSILNRE